MHGDVGVPIEHRYFELLQEQPLAADRRQRAIENLIAARAQRHEFDGHACVLCAQPRRDMICLPQGESTLARGDAQGIHEVRET